MAEVRLIHVVIEVQVGDEPGPAYEEVVLPLLSPATRFAAKLPRATYLLFEQTEGTKLVPFASSPSALTLIRTVRLRWQSRRKASRAETCTSV